jgi:hypothetical protein
MWTRGIPDDDAQDWNSCATTTGEGKFRIGTHYFFEALVPQTALRIARPNEKGPPERPMVPKASGAFALPCQFAADRLAAAAGLTLALHWPSGPWPLDPWPFGRWSRRTPVTIGIGRNRHSSLLARDGARDHSINRTIQRSTKPLVFLREN